MVCGVIEPRVQWDKILVGILVTVLVLISFGGTLIMASDALGGASSSKVVEKSGVSGAPLLIERSGLSDSSLLAGLAPVVGTLDATDLTMDGGTKATLEGRVSGMNGFPKASVYFEWGYSPDNLSSSTSEQAITSTGTYTGDLEGYDPDETVYYRFVSAADGTVYGGIKSFQAQGAVATSYRILIILPIVWIALAILTIWGLTSFGLPLVLAVIFGAIIAQLGAIGAEVILESLLQWW